MMNVGRGGPVLGAQALLLNHPYPLETWPDSAMFARVDSQTLRELRFTNQIEEHSVQKTVFSLNQLAEMAGIPNKEKARLGIDTTPGADQKKLLPRSAALVSSSSEERPVKKAGIQSPAEFAAALEGARSNPDRLKPIVVRQGEARVEDVLQRHYGEWAVEIPSSVVKYGLAEVNPSLDLKALRAGQVVQLP